MERYTPVRGMIVCSEGGDYILYEDHIAYLRSFEEHHNAQVAELEKEVRKLPCVAESRVSEGHPAKRGS